MTPLGHIAVAYLLYSGYHRYTSTTSLLAVPTVVLAFGAIFPDLIDKPLAWQLGILPTGRSLAHSLLVLGLLCFFSYLLAGRAKQTIVVLAFAIGAISHAVVDALPALWGGSDPAPLLWPVLAVEPYGTTPPTVFELLRETLHRPYFYLEILLFILAFITWRADGYPGHQLLLRKTIDTNGPS